MSMNVRLALSIEKCWKERLYSRCLFYIVTLLLQEADFRENQTQNQNRYRKLIKKKNQRGVKTNLDQQRGVDNSVAQPGSVKHRPEPIILFHRAQFLLTFSSIEKSSPPDGGYA